MYIPITGHTQPTNQTIRYSTSGVPPATAQSSYQSKARSNFLLGPSKSVIFDKSDMQVINFIADIVIKNCCFDSNPILYPTAALLTLDIQK